MIHYKPKVKYKKTPSVSESVNEKESFAKCKVASTFHTKHKRCFYRRVTSKPTFSLSVSLLPYFQVVQGGILEIAA